MSRGADNDRDTHWGTPTQASPDRPDPLATATRTPSGPAFATGVLVEVQQTDPGIGLLPILGRCRGTSAASLPLSGQADAPVTAPAPGWDADAALARLGITLKRARSASGMSANIVAKEIRSHRNWIFRVEGGEEVGLRSIAAFAEALDVSTSVLVDAYLGSHDHGSVPFERVGAGGATAFGHELRHLRHRAGLKLDEAEAAGAGRRSYLGLLERGGVRSPSITLTHRIVGALIANEEELRDHLVRIVGVFAGEVPAPSKPPRVAARRPTELAAAPGGSSWD